MLRQIKWMLGVVGALVALLALVFGAFATGPAQPRAAARPGAKGLFEPAAACTKLKVTDVVWVTLDADGAIDQEVQSYPSGTSTITPVFQYNCVPKRITVVSVFSRDGESVYSDKETLKATNTKGLYSYPLGTTDGSPMDEGKWSVEFYNNKTLIASGEVQVGDASTNPSGNTATVQGTITDKKTRKPITNAIALVFVPGTTVQQWLDGGQQQEQVYTVGKTDSTGKFVLEKPLERNTTYSLLITARGYKPLGTDSFQISDTDQDPVDLTIRMTK
jgi:hypothetical protein